MAFLDLHKAYDKIWKATVSANLWSKGIRGKIWRIIRNLNNNLTSKIKTRFGYTRNIKIEESLRQGGVLSGTEFASLIDCAEDELKAAGLGVQYGDTLLSSLLLMDDIILLAESPQQLQSMLDTMDKFASKHHLTYNLSKSKVMITGPAPRPNPQWRLGELILEEVNQYTYLGEVIASNLKMNAHLNHLQQKLIVNLNRIFAIGTDETLSRIKMDVFLQLHSKCLLPSLLYNAETWTLTMDEEKRLERMHMQALRRYLKTPTSTPKLAYYAELGIYPLQASIDIAQLKYLWRILISPTQVNSILMTQVAHNTKGSWYTKIYQKLIRYGLPNN